MHGRTFEDNHISSPPRYWRVVVALIVRRVFSAATICYLNAMIARIRFQSAAENYS